MMNRGLVNDQIRGQILEGLKQIVEFERPRVKFAGVYTNGDLKESFKIGLSPYQLASDSKENSLKLIWIARQYLGRL